MGFLVDQKIRIRFSWLPPLQLLESLVFLHQETLVLLLKKLDNGLKANSTHKFPMESSTVFHNGENCPFADFGEFQGWFESTTGFTIPIPDTDFIGAALECLHEGNGCPSEEEAIAFVQNELELDLDDELLSTIYNCAGDFVDQLGLGHLLDYFM